MQKYLNSKFQRLYSLLFTLALIFSLLLSSVIVVDAQHPTSRQEFKDLIEQHAVRHAKQGEAKTDRILSLYRDNQFGVTPVQIEEIYETAFNQLSKPSNPFAALFSQLPQWFLLGLTSVVTIIAMSFQEQLKKKLAQLWEWLFQRLAGTLLLRNQALKRYRQRIIEEHEQLYIPFRPQRPLAMNQIYVALKVSGGSTPSSQTGVQSGFDAEQAVQASPRLMVTGAPGSGKTMLLKYLFLSYAQGQLLLPKRPVPVLLELHRISDAKLTQEKLIQAIIQVFGRYGWPKADGFVRQSLKQGQLMLLFDGLDEVSSDVRLHVSEQINNLLQTYPDCRAVITCRTMVYDGAFSPPVTDKLLEVVEFTDQQIRRFLGVWEAQMPPERSLEQLLQTLRDRPRIMALARNPLLLTIIAFLYTDTEFELPHSRAEFYQESTRFLLGQWNKDRNQYKTNEKQLVLQHLALYNQEKGGNDHRDRRSLDYQTVLEQIQTVLPGLNRSAEADTRPILTEMIERSGLFLRLDSGERYQFAHLTLQEYFAAESLGNKESELLTRFQADPSAWREVVKLWCGLPNDSTSLIAAVYQLDPMIGFECLADAVNVQDEVANQVIEGFKSQLERAATEEPIAQAFGTVASNARPRGQVVFQFLVKSLEGDGTVSSQGKACRQGAANALSWTNLPQAVPVLNQYYDTDELNLREPLVRMGNLAISALSEWGNHHSLWSVAIADLASIGTGEAALALVPLLWDHHDKKAIQTAWQLGAMIRLPFVEEKLRYVTLTPSLHYS